MIITLSFVATVTLPDAIGQQPPTLLTYADAHDPAKIASPTSTITNHVLFRSADALASPLRSIVIYSSPPTLSTNVVGGTTNITSTANPPVRLETPWDGEPTGYRP
jgi:hypothetical protein